MELLFSYGTLQQENVQLANFGRRLKGVSDTLVNYKIDKIKITDKCLVYWTLLVAKLRIN